MCRNATAFALAGNKLTNVKQKGERNLQCKHEFVLESVDLSRHCFQITASEESTQ